MPDFTKGPIQVVELAKPLGDWTGARFILRAPGSAGGRSSPDRWSGRG